MRHIGSSVLVCRHFQINIGALISLRIWSQLRTTHLMILSDHFHLIRHWFPDRSGVFQDDNATIRKGALVTLWFEQHE